MGRDPGTTACERARTWAALRPDCETSAIETRLLEAHLAGCADCRWFAETVGRVTELVRAVPSEAPVRSLDLGVLRRSRVRASIAAASQAGVAAAAVLAAFAIGVAFPGHAVDAPQQDAAPASFDVAMVSADAPNEGELLRRERAGDPNARIGATTRRFGSVL